MLFNNLCAFILLCSSTASSRDLVPGIPSSIVNSIFAADNITDDNDDSQLSTEDIIMQLAAMDSIIEFEKEKEEKEKERDNKIEKINDKNNIKTEENGGKGILSEAELLEIKEQEDEDRYFNDVLRANTVKDDISTVEESMPRMPVLEGTDKSVLTEEEEEDKYFESIVQAVKDRPSGYLDEDGDVGVGVGHGIREDYGIGVISGSNHTNKMDSNTNPIINSNSTMQNNGIISKTVKTGIANPLNQVKKPNTEIDFTESLTMTAMDKGATPVPFSSALSKSRPCTSLSFSSPSPPTSSSSTSTSTSSASSSSSYPSTSTSSLPLPAPLPTPTHIPIVNPFGKENRSKTDDEENRIQAEILSIAAIENIMNKKRQVADDILKDQKPERIDLSIMSTAVTAVKERQLKDSQLNVNKEVGENSDINDNNNNNSNNDNNGGDDDLKDEFYGEGEELAIMKDVAMSSNNTPPAPVPALASVSCSTLPAVPFRGVNGQPVTLYSNGNPSCNLPDHRVSAGCTAVLAVVKDQRLYVANAGMV